MTSCEERIAPDERLPPTDVRIGMRALLAIATVIGLVAAGLGLVLRQFPRNVQTPLLLYWAVLALVLIVCVAVVGQRRRYVEKLSGVPRFVLAPHSYLFPQMPRLSAVTAGTCCLVLSVGYGILLTVELAQGEVARIRSFMWQSFYAVSGCAVGIGFLWWNRTVSLYDDGALVRYTLVPWSDNQRQYWDGCYHDVMVLEWQSHVRTAVRVPAEERARVEAFVRERIAAAKSRLQAGRQQPLATA